MARVSKPTIELYWPADSEEPTWIEATNGDMLEYSRLSAAGEVPDTLLGWRMGVAWAAARRLGLVDRNMPFTVFVDEADVGDGERVDEVDPTRPDPGGDS
jgi:hypothetical protein